MVNQGKVDSISKYSKQRFEQLVKVVEQASQLADKPASDKAFMADAGEDSDDDFYAHRLPSGSQVDVL